MARAAAVTVVLLAVAACGVAAAISKTHGVAPSDLPLYEGVAEFSCKDGSQKLPASAVNDEFCDCTDGSDEPGTSACSNGRFYCPNKGHKSAIVFSSRVNDGICDCCDGSDEYSGVVQCSDRCKEEGAEQRNDLIKFIQSQEKGLAKRSEYVAAAQAIIQEKIKRKVELMKEMDGVDAERSKAEETKNELQAKHDAEESARRELREKEEAAKAESEAKANEGAEVKAADEGSLEAGETPPQVVEDGGASGGGDGEAVGEGEFESEAAGGEEEFPEGFVDAEDSYDDEVERAFAEGSTEKTEEMSLTEQMLVDARKVYNDLDSKWNKLNKDIKDVEAVLERDYSPDSAFLALDGKCYNANIQQYTYEICMFGRTAQKEGGSSTNLGTFSSWADGHSVMHYTGGGGCWNGPTRSMKVNLLCGEDDFLVGVTEPSKCEYHADFMTPLACSEEMAKAAKAQLAEMGG